MAQEEKKKRGLSRREFLKDAGLVVGGAAIGSVGLASACSSGAAAGGSTVTTTSPGQTITTTVPNQTITTTLPPVTTTVTQNVDTRSVFNVNGQVYKLDIEPYWSLNFVLREKLGLTFTKLGCDRGECGHCTVLIDGVPMYSCMVLAGDATNKQIETAESLSPDLMNLAPIAQSFRDNEAFQCGWCTAGFMMSTKALLAANPHPTIQQVKQALSGHVCVCSAVKEVCETVVKIGAGG
jgi:aerobic-type carbon monoxide dehydrogenase small subunit (CoxS/CutS family)